jgi:hypothetical protein
VAEAARKPGFAVLDQDLARHAVKVPAERGDLPSADRPAERPRGATRAASI